MANQPIGADPGWRGVITTVADVQGRCESGWSVGFADPEHRLAFGYAPNFWAELSASFSTPFRFQALVEAVSRLAPIWEGGLRA